MKKVDKGVMCFGIRVSEAIGAAGEAIDPGGKRPIAKHIGKMFSEVAAVATEEVVIGALPLKF